MMGQKNGPPIWLGGLIGRSISLDAPPLEALRDRANAALGTHDRFRTSLRIITSIIRDEEQELVHQLVKSLMLLERTCSFYILQGFSNLLRICTGDLERFHHGSPLVNLIPDVVQI